MKANTLFGIALLVSGVGASIFMLSIGGCVPAAPSGDPEPSRAIAQFSPDVTTRGSGADITEFRDSAGRICVLAYYGGRIALDCGYPRILNYEDLPPIEK